MLLVFLTSLVLQDDVEQTHTKVLLQERKPYNPAHLTGVYFSQGEFQKQLFADGWMSNIELGWI